ncbi:uncharacterized protein LOC128813009 [Vidua macroura]|uniref:uncharacterized protein LOC128813009 n=1 Tax=Vidua macroura TaxID=187451 RepID=UPI0023A870B8|nr:uncharacterized protein LOC128813009 [Vidua macroura]
MVKGSCNPGFERDDCGSGGDSSNLAARREYSPRRVWEPRRCLGGGGYLPAEPSGSEQPAEADRAAFRRGPAAPAGPAGLARSQRDSRSPAASAARTCPGWRPADRGGELGGRGGSPAPLLGGDRPGPPAVSGRYRRSQARRSCPACTEQPESGHLRAASFPARIEQVWDWRGAACPSHRFPVAPVHGPVSSGASVSSFSSGGVRMHRIPLAAITRRTQNRCVYSYLHCTRVHLGQSHRNLALLVLKVPLKGQAKPTRADAGLKLLQKDLQGK